MPWMEVRTMGLRGEFVFLARTGNLTFTQLCRRYNIAPNLAEFYQSEQPRSGIFRGFAGVAEDEMETAMARLTAIIRTRVKK